MTIARVLALAQKECLRTEMEVFLAFLLKRSRLDLIARGEEEVPVEALAELETGWTRLKKGCPVAYLTHEKEFYGMSFYVDERVLIPRPCTEQLVDWTAQVAEQRVLEVGTGSGAIAIALKKRRPDLEILATDVSEGALDIANKNCVQNGLNVQFFCSDLLAQISPQACDTLVANLPYIGTQEHDLIDANVANHEPGLALYGGEDGLRLYARLFEEARAWPFRFILGEIGFTQGKAIQALAEAILPEFSFTLRQDLEGLDRHFLLEKTRDF